MTELAAPPRADRPLPAGGPVEVAVRVRDALGPVLPELGRGEAAFDELAALVVAETVHVRHPHTVAHLHCPSLPVAVTADALMAALNPSMDSWDQSAAPSVIEAELIGALGGLCFGGCASHPGGTVTTGGSESNLMALMFARDEAIRRAFDTDPAEDGIPGYAAGRLRILCSAVAHFSVSRAAAQLGLGERAVVPVPVGDDHRMDVRALERAAARVVEDGEIVVAVVATAGTTDFGAIDPLAACARVARRLGAWFHVDAAYGGALLFSDLHRPLLDGIAQADTVTLDLHKFGWQPIPAGILLCREQAAFGPLTRRVAYLSALDDERAGYPNLLDRSLRTTRRADAVKIVATCQTLGRAGLAALIERCFALAAHAADRLRSHPDFELVREPVLTTVLFRYRVRFGDPDRVNGALRRRLLAEGAAVIGRTELPGPDGKPAGPGCVRLKLTLVNPEATTGDLDLLLDLIAAAGAAEDQPS
ncbi:MAG TPA: aspartate aminotransferase family protein [Actinocrinis sp.]|uniref:pyridoxal phosphate-dependent decarboxylase family protein n=1 Tax=Actinocrinis sp. TaxID=1920516 RepID=UPI002DDD257C|nr:aspartate aminotransferase family protein [Actinocrinis sp.]HEV2346517.1 aspartate aminotransferase family protein [Actinocrinis sp.]